MGEFDAIDRIRMPEELAREVAAHVADFRDSCGREQVDASALLERHEAITRVWAASDFVARACVRHPAMAVGLAEGGFLDRAHDRTELEQRVAGALQAVSGENDLMAVLRALRRRQMVCIAWRDLAGEAPLAETLAALSDLAEVLVGQALNWLDGYLEARFGRPRDRDGNPQHLVVLGMGKLGGRELNFSSDIDLMFAFPEHGETDGTRPLANEEYFRRLGQALIRVLDQVTADGFVFRVDMRLRPFGDAGPLVAPFSAMEDYYQQHGREWERYALIKARVIAGDRVAGERLLEVLRPFVYRRYLDYGAIEALREMKSMIAREVERKGLRRNIKLGPGGIREIEFIAQAFQLIYGGREPGLRVRGLAEVLQYLGATDRLPGFAVDGLLQAYEFHRLTENRLQAWADRQTHVLPEDDAGKQRLAFSMGYPDWRTFVEALMHHVRLVSGQFEQVFAAPQAEEVQGAGANSGEVDFAAVWQGTVDSEVASAFMAQHGYEPADRALGHLEHLHEHVGRRRLGKHGQRRLEQLMPLLLGAVAAGPEPCAVLERLVSLIEAVAQRSVYLALLVENPIALSQLVKLCGASVWIAQYLARYPLLLDELLDPSTLYRPLDRERLAGELDRDLDRVPAGDTEQVMDNLRHFKHTQVLRVAAADVSEAMPLMIVSDYLTEIAEVILRKTLELAWADLVPRFGRPWCEDAGERREAGFAVIAYGKLGGWELGYGSDLDVVFLHDSRGEDQVTDGARSIDNASFFARLAQRVIHFLTTHTAAGVLYEVDTRLRPSGRSGLLVSGFDAFANYQRDQAWTWEHQALVRARAVGGSPAIAESFRALRQEILGRRRDRTQLRKEVREMRERMRRDLSRSRAGQFDLKQDPGGMADIEFITQYMVLAHGCDEPVIARFTDNVRQLAGLEATGILSSWDAGLLRDAFRALRKKMHRMKLAERDPLVEAAEWRTYRQQVQRIWAEQIGED